MLNTNALNATSLKEKDVFVESFWYYQNYTSYLKGIGIMTVILSILTFIFRNSPVFIATMGPWSSMIEAMLGVPQFYLNYQKKNTEGLAPLLIMMWLFGDFYKLTYYYSYDSPLQLIICSVFQICTDITIISQFWLYRHNNRKLKRGEQIHANQFDLVSTNNSLNTDDDNCITLNRIDKSKVNTLDTTNNTMESEIVEENSSDENTDKKLTTLPKTNGVDDQSEEEEDNS